MEPGAEDLGLCRWRQDPHRCAGQLPCRHDGEIPPAEPEDLLFIHQGDSDRGLPGQRDDAAVRKGPAPPTNSARASPRCPRGGSLRPGCRSGPRRSRSRPCAIQIGHRTTGGTLARKRRREARAIAAAAVASPAMSPASAGWRNGIVPLSRARLGEVGMEFKIVEVAVLRGGIAVELSLQLGELLPE